mgnify:FL=1
MGKRRWLVVPRGEVEQNLALARSEGVGEIEERDGVTAPFLAEESWPPPSPGLDWKALWLAADTQAKKLAVIAKMLELT